LILTARKRIQLFFDENKELFEDFYPGLSLNRLLIEAENFSRYKGAYFTNWLDTVVIAARDSILDQFFRNLIEGVPFSHISTSSYFYCSEFLTGPEVLTPRYETEMLVELALKGINDLGKKLDNGQVKVVDVGTGTGAIALCLLQNSKFPLDLLATDISKDALKFATNNFFRLQYRFSSKHNYNLMIADRLFNIDSQRHIIVSNPPYIKKRADRDGVHDKADQFCPHLALYLEDEDYNEWFKIFFEQSLRLLYNGGAFLMEGHENHLFELQKMAQDIGFKDVQIIKDLTGRDRFLVATKE
jgi:release factor glutamine methyltransferase